MWTNSDRATQNKEQTIANNEMQVVHGIYSDQNIKYIYLITHVRGVFVGFQLIQVSGIGIPLKQDIWTTLYYKSFPMNVTHGLTSSGAISANFYDFYHTSSLSVENYVAIALLDYVSATIKTYLIMKYVILGNVFCSEGINHHHVVHDIIGEVNF